MTDENIDEALAAKAYVDEEVSKFWDGLGRFFFGFAMLLLPSVYWYSYVIQTIWSWDLTAYGPTPSIHVIGAAVLLAQVVRNFVPMPQSVAPNSIWYAVCWRTSVPALLLGVAWTWHAFGIGL